SERTRAKAERQGTLRLREVRRPVPLVAEESKGRRRPAARIRGCLVDLRVVRLHRGDAHGDRLGPNDVDTKAPRDAWVARYRRGPGDIIPPEVTRRPCGLVGRGARGRRERNCYTCDNDGEG